MKELEVLFWADHPLEGRNAGTILDHIHSFFEYSEHSLHSLPIKGALPRRLNLDWFDVLVIHYSLYIPLDSYISRQSKARIQDFKGLKVVYLQDEYRNVWSVVKQLQILGIDILFTCVPAGEMEKVYPSTILPKLRKVNVLTGYVPEELTHLEVPQIAQREIDVGYRARKPPYWLGALGVEKYDIADRFRDQISDIALNLDLSCEEEDRIYGEDWIRFLTSCKTTLGVESGASLTDFTGELQRAVSSFLESNPDAEFHEVHELFFKEYEGNVCLNQISPRCFEAAALKTTMILYEGEYSGILEPWQHYIPLQKDFGNFPEILEVLRDSARLQTIADRCYEEIALNPEYSYRSHIDQFDRVLAEEFKQRKCTSAEPGLSSEEIEAILEPHISDFILDTDRAILTTGLKIWRRTPNLVKKVVRPIVRLIRST